MKACHYINYQLSTVAINGPLRPAVYSETTQLDVELNWVASAKCL